MSGGTMASDVDLTARERLLRSLQEDALVIGEVVLTSGRTAQYLVDAKRAILRREGFMALAELVAAQAAAWGATAVGGMTMGADPIACAALAGGADVKAFFVRKEAKKYGTCRIAEGLASLRGLNVCIIEDVITTGGSTRDTIEALQAAGAEVVGAASIIDRSGGKAGVGVARISLATLDVAAVPFEDCDACKRGEPVVKPGSRAGGSKA